MQEAGGVNKRAEVAFPWKAGRPHFLYTFHLGGSQWGAWVIDGTTGELTTVGVLPVAPHTKLFQATMTPGPSTGSAAPEAAGPGWE